MILNDEQLAAIRAGKRVFSWEAMEDVFQVIDDLKRQLAECNCQLALASDYGFGSPKAQFDAYVQEKVDAERKKWLLDLVHLLFPDGMSGDDPAHGSNDLPELLDAYTEEVERLAANRANVRKTNKLSS